MLLQEHFSEKVIFRNVPVNYLARSAGLILWKLLWSKVKSKIYANNQRTIDNLKTNIRNVIFEIWIQMCENVMISFSFHNFNKDVFQIKIKHLGGATMFVFFILKPKVLNRSPSIIRVLWQKPSTKVLLNLGHIFLVLRRYNFNEMLCFVSFLSYFEREFMALFGYTSPFKRICKIILIIVLL